MREHRRPGAGSGPRGHDLLADSRVVLDLPSLPPDGCNALLLTADARTAVCGTYALPGKCAAAEPGFAVYSSVPGRRDGFVYRHTGACYDGYGTPLWASPSGSTLIGTLTVSVLTPKPHLVTNTGVFSNGQFRPPPFLASENANLSEIAF